MLNRDASSTQVSAKVRREPGAPCLLNFVSPEETKRQNLELESQRSELERLMNEWEELGLVLEG